MTLILPDDLSDVSVISQSCTQVPSRQWLRRAALALQITVGWDKVTLDRRPTIFGVDQNGGPAPQAAGPTLRDSVRLTPGRSHHHKPIEVGGLVEGAAFLEATGGPVEPGGLGLAVGAELFDGSALLKMQKRAVGAETAGDGGVDQVAGVRGVHLE